MSKKKEVKCSFCGLPNTDPRVHIIMKGDKANICTDCIMSGLLTIIRKIPA